MPCTQSCHVVCAAQSACLVSFVPFVLSLFPPINSIESKSTGMKLCRYCERQVLAEDQGSLADCGVRGPLPRIGSCSKKHALTIHAIDCNLQ